MNFESEEDRILFLKYALPCSATLVKRGVISKKHMIKLIKNLSHRKVSEHIEDIFKTANFMCEKLAKKLGKKFIDKDVVRKYFLFEHDKVVDNRHKIFKDFDSVQCRVYSGKVISLNKGAVVKTIIGKKKYRTDFVQNLKIGDYVVVHRNFIVEKITENLAKKLWNLKEEYFKSNKILL